MKNSSSSLTLRGLIIGIIGLVIITSSSLYVALKMGALPWPTVFVTVLSMVALKKAKGSTIQEVNTTHTLMSAGAMVAGGLAFTLPGLWILNPSANISVLQVVILSVTGALLGTLFTSIFRLTFIEKEKLPYPIGVSSYTTLKVGMEKGEGGKTLFTSLGLSALFTFLRDKLLLIPAVVTPFKGSALLPALSIYVSPMAFGIGAIIGPVLALVWILGTVFGYYILTPVGLATGFFDSMASADIFRQNLGIGLMIGTGIGVFIKAIIDLVKKQRIKGEKKEVNKKLMLAIAITLLFATILLSLTTEITILEAILLIVGVFLTTYLSGMLTGQTGVNPMEIFAILVLLGITVLVKPTMLAAFSITAVVAIACGLTGDVMNDLKSGHELKNDPKAQLVAEGIGGVIGAIVASLVLFALKKSFGGFGTPSLPAPQANAVASMIGGMGNNTALLIGVAIGIILYFIKLPTATLGLGVYLPNYLSSIVALGALTVYVAKLIVKKTKKEFDLDQNTALISSGLLGGEGVTGVLIAIFSMFTM